MFIAWFPGVCILFLVSFRDPEWADVKLAQAKYLLSRVAQFKELVSEKYECMPSVILAGDFNSIPGDKVCALLSFCEVVVVHVMIHEVTFFI